MYVLYNYNYTVAAAQPEGPGIVIAHPGQDVELLCAVTEDSQDLVEAWQITEEGVYKISALYGGKVTGYGVPSSDSSNLIVENITMHDVRNGSEYICLIVPENVERITREDILNESDPTYLYVAGE